MELETVKPIFDKLFADINGRNLSLESRERQQQSSKSFVYGEVVPDSFYELIQEAKPYPGQIFYDLGSGTGKAVLLAHLLFDFKKSIGIEYLDSLYNASIKMEKQFEAEFAPSLSKELAGKQMELRLGSFLELDFFDADFIFMNSTCFQDDLMEALEERLEKIHPHATVITLSKSLKSPYFHQYKHKMYEFSWGQATAFFHRKRLWKTYM